MPIRRISPPSVLKGFSLLPIVKKNCGSLSLERFFGSLGEPSGKKKEPVFSFTIFKKEETLKNEGSSQCTDLQPIVHPALKNEKLSISSYPSLNEILKDVGYHEEDFSGEGLRSFQLSKSHLDNFKSISALLKWKEPSYDGIGLTEKTGSDSFVQKIVNKSLQSVGRFPELTDKVIVHSTTFENAESLLTSNGEFSGLHLTASLYDPKNENVKCFPGSVGLILDVPTESIMAAYNIDRYAVNSNSINHNVTASLYQLRIVKNYINSVLTESSLSDDFFKSRKMIDPLNENKTADDRLAQKLGLENLRILTEFYREGVNGMTEDWQKRFAFSTLFRREGTDVVGELEHTCKAAQSCIDNSVKLSLSASPEENPFGRFLLGKFDSPEQIMIRTNNDPDFTNPIVSSWRWNTIVIHSPSSARELGLKPIAIKGVLKIKKDPSFDQTILPLTKELGLPVFSHPEPIDVARRSGRTYWAKAGKLLRQILDLVD